MDATDTDGATAEATAGVSAAASVDGIRGAQFVLPPEVEFEPNPLGLRVAAPPLEPESRVFAVPKRMLAVAHEGSSLALRAATVERVEGGEVVVQMGREASYPVHPAYVVAPPRGTARRGSAVIAASGGGLGHAVVVGFKRDRVIVRFLDSGPGYERSFHRDDVYPQTAGLRPGNYAALGKGQQLEHVLLVSVGEQAGAGGRRWLVLGYAGAARLVEESELAPLPLQLSAKVGATVAVPWLGTLVPAKVLAVDPVGLVTVRRSRASSSFVVGPGMVLEASRP